MAKFLLKKNPPHWLYLPSQRRVRELVKRVNGDVRKVEFAGIVDSGEGPRHSVGYAEARVVDESWCFLLHFWAICERAVEGLRDTFSDTVLAEIERFIATCLKERPADVIKPRQLYLSFLIENQTVRADCDIKPVGPYSFSSGKWWLTPDDSAES